MFPIELARAALWWGPGVVLLILFGYGFLKLAYHWVEKVMDYRRFQLEGMFGMTRQYIEQFLNTQRSQAETLTRLVNFIEQRESHESFEHQEILIALKAMHRELTALGATAKVEAS